MINWNNLSGYANQTAAALVDSNNNPTSAGVAWNATDPFDVFGTSEASYPNAQLINSYLDNNARATDTVTVSGIPYANYSVYVYVASNGNGREGTVTIGNLGYSFSTTANNGPNPYTYTLVTSTTAGVYSPGNYVVFTGMSGSSFTIDQTEVSNCGIAAVEIVGDPIPALNVLPVTTPVSVASGATLDLTGGTQQVASLSDATPGQGGTIQNSATYSASILTLATTGGSTTFSGQIAGGGTLGSVGLVMSGSGLQVLSGSNTYTGGTTISSGTLQVAASGALPGYATPGTITAARGGMLAVSAGGSGWTAAGIGTLASSNSGGFASGSWLGIDTTGGSLTCNSNIAGSMGLAKLGGNTLVLAGSNTYAGPTTISQGTLEVNGSLASPVTVNRGGSLSGTGSLANVTVTPGGQLAPGDALGVMDVSGSLNLELGAVMDFELDTPSTSDMISMPTGQLVLNGQQFSDCNFTWSANFQPGTYNLIEAQSISGSLGASTSGTIDGIPATLFVQGNDLVLAVPEPSTLTLLGVGVLGLICWARRRRDRDHAATTRCLPGR